MNLENLKRELVDICHCASERWLTAGSGGNISVRIPGTDRYLCTATGVTFRDTVVENVVEMDLAGNQHGARGLQGTRICASTTSSASWSTSATARASAG